MMLVIMLMTLMLINKFLESCHFWPVHVSFVSKFADHQIQTYIYTSFCLPEIEHRFSVIMRCIVISQPATIAPFSQKKTLVSLLYYQRCSFSKCSQWRESRCSPEYPPFCNFSVSFVILDSLLFCVVSTVQWCGASSICDGIIEDNQNKNCYSNSKLDEMRQLSRGGRLTSMFWFFSTTWSQQQAW